MTFTFRHPKYYKELRMQYGPQPANCDSEEKSEDRVARGPGLKLPGPRPISNANKGLIHRRQATSTKLQALKATSHKRQAPSKKVQASSHKLQAPRFLNLETIENDSWYTDQGPGPR